MMDMILGIENFKNKESLKGKKSWEMSPIRLSSNMFAIVRNAKEIMRRRKSQMNGLQTMVWYSSGSSSNPWIETN